MIILTGCKYYQVTLSLCKSGFVQTVQSSSGPRSCISEWTNQETVQQFSVEQKSSSEWT